MSGKVAIYTALTGLGRDKLRTPSVVHENVEYIALVSQFVPEIHPWQQRIVPIFSTLDEVWGQRRASRMCKALSHLYLNDYECSIWIDSTHEVVADPIELCNTHLRYSDIALWTHILRDCVYDEAAACLSLNRDRGSRLNFQTQTYLGMNYPKNNGLYETSAMIRNHTTTIARLNCAWWEHMCMFSSRDQISLPVVLWKLGIQPAILPDKINVRPDGTGNNKLIPKIANFEGAPF